MNIVRRCQAMLGTYVDVALSGSATERSLSEIADRVFAAIQRVQAAMSVHDPDSELSRVNRLAHQHSVAISAPLTEVLKQALALSDQSEGAFDVTAGTVLVRQRRLPRQSLRLARMANWKSVELRGNSVRFTDPLCIDLGGIAKGYAVDCASQQIPNDIDYMINAGGDLRCRPWLGREVWIRHPTRSTQAHALTLNKPALATSAHRKGSRFSDIVGLDRRRLRRRRGSWTVAADNAMLADGLTKVLQVHQEPIAILRHYGATAYVLNCCGTFEHIEGVPE